MIYRWLADAVVVLHTWGALVEYAEWICPLTPLENALRHRAGDAGYAGSFVKHYFIPVLYPAGLTTSMHWVLGSAVLVVNAVAYGVLIARMRRS